MKRHIKSIIIIVCTCLCFINSFSTYAQFKIPKKPKSLKNQKGVYDYINLLSKNEVKNLNQKLIRYSDSTSTQIVIAIINSTKGEYINYLGAQWGEKWGIGQEKEDNGILILLAKTDRKISINTGKGIEHILTDALSKRIIEHDIIPYFKRNNYYGGLNKGTDVIFEVLTGLYKNKRSNNSKFPTDVFIFLFFVIIIFIMVIFKKRSGGNRRNSTSNSTILEAIILSNMGKGYSKRSSSGRFGGSSGNFSGGFGGGSFGGGGALGSW